MARDNSSLATRNRRIRQEALREQLQAKGLERHVLDIADKLQTEGASMEAQEIQALKASAELRLKLLNKCLPDLKATELSGPGGEAVELDMTWSIKVVE